MCGWLLGNHGPEKHALIWRDRRERKTVRGSAFWTRPLWSRALSLENSKTIPPTSGTWIFRGGIAAAQRPGCGYSVVQSRRVAATTWVFREAATTWVFREAAKSETSTPRATHVVQTGEHCSHERRDGAKQENGIVCEHHELVLPNGEPTQAVAPFAGIVSLVDRGQESDVWILLGDKRQVALQPFANRDCDDFGRDLTEYPRRRGISTWQPRRRRDSSAECPRSESTFMMSCSTF